jgi:hypothetical protein
MKPTTKSAKKGKLTATKLGKKVSLQVKVFGLRP